MSATQWIDAASLAFQQGGLGAIKVEAIARRLGVTKGSFYWHFADRSALVLAVVERWESEHIEAMIAEAQHGANPTDQIRRLILAVSKLSDHRGEQLLYLQAEGEGVRGALERVTDRRLDYLRDLIMQLGPDQAEAERRAALALAASEGMQQLATGAPGAMSRSALLRGGFTDHLFNGLVAN